MAAPNTELFPTIGQVAEDTDKNEQLDSNEEGTGDEDTRAVQVIESLCMRCHEQGSTRLLLTSIPFFREVVVMSFRCEHCGFQNNEIQSAGQIRPEGVTYTVRMLARPDLDRQLVKSETCTVIIPDFELTIPPNRGQLTTVEGLLRDIVTDLSGEQPFRRIADEAVYNKIQAIIDGIKDILGDDEDEKEEDEDVVGLVKSKSAAHKDIPMKPFVITLDDPTGNSFVEFVGSMADPKWNMRTYRRTHQQNIDLGLVNPDAEEKEDDETDGLDGKNEEIYIFPGHCSSCGHPSDTLVKKVNIPYFKDILIMSVNCDLCGYRDNEVKSGSAISTNGKRITLKVEDSEDLSRDILKSESCGLAIPEIDLVLQPGTLGGRFTTLEGILDQVYEELSIKVYSDARKGDEAFETFLAKLKAVKTAEHPFTIILDDPLSNSYLQNLYAPDPDPNMTIEEYERTWDQNEELGLNDMKVEGYEGDPNMVVEKAEGVTEATEDGEVKAPS
ncbi:zf-ZPR1-domain-containing protein [Trametopsis cervina]|nr:zf-ZPR1-domain-containing protein [Trametopsis cervina]